MRVLVLGAGGAAADNFIKSLRMACPDAWVLGADVNPYLLELSSADETVLIHTRPADNHSHLQTMYDLVEEHGITLIHGQPDEEALFLSMYDLPTFMPEEHVIGACQDKLKTADLLGDLAPLSDHYGAGLSEGPLWMRAKRGAGSLAAKMVRDADEAAAWAQVWAGRVSREDFMLAEVLPGRDVSYTGVWWRGEPVAAACRERVEYADTRTPSGQSSSPRVARLVSDGYVFDAAEAAVRRVNEKLDAVPHGVFYVDMKEDAQGVPKITEINAGRFNTTQNFYAEAGFNLVKVYVALHIADGDVHLENPRFKRDDDLYWVRQPDMGHKLITRTRVPA